jgi:hypothetical protein
MPPFGKPKGDTGPPGLAGSPLLFQDINIGIAEMLTLDSIVLY